MKKSIQSFRDLETYQLSLREANAIFELTRRFPREERYGLTVQIRRSSSAVSALIAEGWARRRYPRAFLNTLAIALGEAGETQAWLDHAWLRGYVSDTEFEEFDAAWQRIGGKINRMIQRSDGFTSDRAT